MGEWEPRVSNREKTSRGHSLFRDENIFREVSWQRIADSDLDDASAPVAISLRVVDRRVINCRLNDMTLAGMVAVFQFLPHFHKRHGALVSENQWKALEVPAIQLFVVRTLLNQLDERRANPRSIYSGQHLTRARARSRYSLHSQVTETNPIQNQGAHINRNRVGHIISSRKQQAEGSRQ
jgi:hypothetical protein